PRFNKCFKNWAHKPEVINDIKSRWKMRYLSYELLEILKVPVKLYPPQTSEDFRALFDDLEETEEQEEQT
ncbi:3124_t:CDS:2, partial [Paraglomus brasilianum]